MFASVFEMFKGNSLEGARAKSFSEEFKKGGFCSRFHWRIDQIRVPTLTCRFTVLRGEYGGHELLMCESEVGTQDWESVKEVTASEKR